MAAAAWLSYAAAWPRGRVAAWPRGCMAAWPRLLGCCGQAGAAAQWLQSGRSAGPGHLITLNLIPKVSFWGGPDPEGEFLGRAHHATACVVTALGLWRRLSLRGCGC